MTTKRLCPFIHSISITITLVCTLSMLSCAQQKYPVIKAGRATHYVNKEVVVKGKVCGYGSSSYFQFATLYLGPDSAHKVLQVMFKGDLYTNSKAKRWIGSYMGKVVYIKGIIKLNPGLCLEATDTIRTQKY